MKSFVQAAYVQSRLAFDLTPKEIHEELIQIHGDSAVTYMTVTRWVLQFRAGKDSFEDQHRSGRPVTETNSANIELIAELIESNSRLSTYDLEELTSLSRGTINRILHDKLDLRKVSSRWIPHQLTAKNKAKRLEFCKSMLAKLKSGEWRLDQILTGDESWFYHRKILKRADCASWRKRDEPPETVVRRSRYEAKTMFVIFFRTTGPVLVHAVEKGETIDSQYYIEKCLGPAFEQVRRERRASGLRGMKLLIDGASCHASKTTLDLINSSGILLIDHPPYSPDLAPSDYWLFDYIKSSLPDDMDAESLTKAITKHLNLTPHKEYIKTFIKYIERLEYCINVGGDYFEHLIK